MNRLLLLALSLVLGMPCVVGAEVVRELSARRISGYTAAARRLGAQDPRRSAKRAESMCNNPLVRAMHELGADQQAALQVTFQICQSHFTRSSSLTTWVSGGSSVVMIVLGIVLVARPVPQVTGALLPMVCVPVVFLLSGLLERGVKHRQAQRQTQVDLLVAQAMEDPRRFLTALEKLEEASTRMTAAMGVPSGLESQYRKRRRRLERSLGLD